MKLHDHSAELETGGNDVTPWVEREATIDASPDEVWEAITDEELREEWLPLDGRTLTVETIEEAERFAFTWERPGEGESYVEFTIEAVPAGTRVVVVETPIGMTGPRASAPAWATRLASLGRACSVNGMTPLVA
jgi:uncharacterized protein YndB with AHSA1/START domain